VIGPSDAFRSLRFPMAVVDRGTQAGRHPWQVDNPSTQLKIRMRSFLDAMKRTERWDGGSLTRRRDELRTLAERAGMPADTLEGLLTLCEEAHEQWWAEQRRRLAAGEPMDAERPITLKFKGPA
jgi:hypothetical protein